MGVVTILRDNQDVIVVVVMEWIHVDYFQIAYTNVFLEAFWYDKITIFVDFPGKFFFFVDFSRNTDGLLSWIWGVNVFDISNVKLCAFLHYLLQLCEVYFIHLLVDFLVDKVHGGNKSADSDKHISCR